MRISDWSSDVCSSDLLAALALPFIVSGRVIATAPPFAAGLGVCFASDLPALSAFLVAMADSCVEPVELMSTTKEWVPDRQAKKERGEKRGQVGAPLRSEEHTSELQSLMRISYAVFCLKKKTKDYERHNTAH